MNKKTRQLRGLSLASGGCVVRTRSYIRSLGASSHWDHLLASDFQSHLFTVPGIQPVLTATRCPDVVQGRSKVGSIIVAVFFRQCKVRTPRTAINLILYIRNVTPFLPFLWKDRKQRKLLFLPRPYYAEPAIHKKLTWTCRHPC